MVESNCTTALKLIEDESPTDHEMAALVEDCSLRAETRAKNVKSQESQKEDSCHFMDKKESAKEASEDVTRESLIALSYRLPEKDLSLELSPEKLNGENLVEGINGDGAEKYRSKLISISNSQSPDIKALPVAQEELKG
ncbi:hypothetical protein F0562_028159 [Nyssa sinensis]|uniref:Uncharacterized protein n=1 Tax=Nyssa sinensis TaxID=561372 RepID=A0A5J5BA56_9ASTE|nr:hypothetical protein F0562_028159 [Nyssa sinensis]